MAKDWIGWVHSDKKATTLEKKKKWRQSLMINYQVLDQSNIWWWGWWFIIWFSIWQNKEKINFNIVMLSSFHFFLNIEIFNCYSLNVFRPRFSLIFILYFAGSFAIFNVFHVQMLQLSKYISSLSGQYCKCLYIQGVWDEWCTPIKDGWKYSL